MFWKKQSEAQDISIQNPMLVAEKEESKDRTLSVLIDIEQLGTPGEAGVMLADIARQMAERFDTTYADVTAEQALAEITAIFDAELKLPTEGRAHTLDQ